MYNETTQPRWTVGSLDTIVDEATADAIDAFIERMELLASQARRSRQQAPPPRGRSRASTANDGRTGREKIDLVLYTSAESEKSQKALRAVRAVLAEYEGSQIKFTVCDLSETDQVEADGIIFTPTLVKRSPGPRTWIVGNLEHRDLLIDMLDVSGVDRRR